MSTNIYTAVTLEEANLMVKPADRSSARHTLLRPSNLQLGNAQQAHPWLTVEELRLDEGDKDDDYEAYIYWDALVEEEVDASVTWDALWQLLRLRDATPREVVAFIEKWGVLGGEWDVTGYGDRFGLDQGAMNVGMWNEFADFLDSLLLLLATTAQGELVDLEFLESIQNWDDGPYQPPDIPFPDPPHFTGLQEYWRARDELHWQALVTEREQGHGIQQQRRLLSSELTLLRGAQYVKFSWDDRNRSMQGQATGLDEIVFSHIVTIFLAPEVDVLICSVCGTPYLFDEYRQGRRPRYGVRRFCSEECRREGKRESNRRSWQRNSNRWRRRTALGNKEEAGDGSTS